MAWANANVRSNANFALSEHLVQGAPCDRVQRVISVSTRVLTRVYSAVQPRMKVEPTEWRTCF
jgi:hypothetical protein